MKTYIISNVIIPFTFLFFDFFYSFISAFIKYTINFCSKFCYIHLSLLIFRLPHSIQINKQMNQPPLIEFESSNLKPQETNTSSNWPIIGFITRHQNAFLILVYIANIVLTGVVGSISLFATSSAPRYVFNDAYELNDSMRVIGSFWIAIGIVSLMGLFRPMKFCPILVVQIIYKGLFLIVEVIPKLARN